MCVLCSPALETTGPRDPHRIKHYAKTHPGPLILFLRPARPPLERCDELKVGFATAHPIAPGHATNTRPSTGMRRHYFKEPRLSGKQRSGYTNMVHAFPASACRAALYLEHVEAACSRPSSTLLGCHCSNTAQRKGGQRRRSAACAFSKNMQMHVLTPVIRKLF